MTLIMDYESGLPRNTSFNPSYNSYSFIATYLRKIQTRISSLIISLIHTSSDKGWKGHTAQIEGYPPGYPRFSALVAAHNSFHLGRRFKTLRTRLLLLKQDKLSLLEKQLDDIDRKETTLLCLGSCRNDDNSERQTVLSQIDSALADYDALVERNHRILGLEAASSRDVVSLQNWVDGNACLARQETDYLAHYEDLFAVASFEDRSVSSMEVWVEDVLTYFHQRLRRVSFGWLQK